MMREVVVHSDIAHLPAHFHASLDIAKTTQGSSRLLWRNPDMTGRRDRSQCVHAVMLTKQFPFNTAHGFAGTDYRERAVGIW